MPLTPFHYPIAYLLGKLDRRLSLPGVIVGSLIPDLEVPVLWILGDIGSNSHLVLHSFLGGLTLGVALAVIITITIYPPIISGVFGVESALVKNHCRLGGVLVTSCTVGVLSHLLLDLCNHATVPLLFPFLWAIPSPVYFALGGPESAVGITHLLLLLMGVGILFGNRHRGWGSLFVE